MTASLNQRAKAAERRQKAWEMHIDGVPQFQIATQLGLTEARVSQLIKSAAALHPVNQLDYNERMALSEERWNLSEAQIREEIQQQRIRGRVTKTVTRFPDGKEQVEVTKHEGVDPALLRCLSTHHDRRARQLNNQISPDAGVNQVNVSLVQDFLGQGESTSKLSAAAWNEAQQEQPTIDV